MIIKEIKIKNFRSYYGENTFSFSEGLTLIIGDNGDGKTTFFEAVQWLLNTSVENKSLDHFSEMRKSQLEIGEHDTVSVSMTFDHDGEKMIEKSFVVERVNDKKYEARSFSFIGYEEQNSERVQIQGKYLINRCYDTFIQRYSMFAGESNLNVFDDETALQQLVDKLSDIHEFDDYVVMADTFEKKSNKAWEKECKADDRITKAANRLLVRKSKAEERLENIKADIKDQQKNINLFSTKIDALEKHKETCARYQEVKEILETRKKEVLKWNVAIAKHDFNINLLDKMWILAPFPKVLQEFKAKSQAFSKEKRKQQKDFDVQKGIAEGKKKVLEELSSFANGVTPLPWYLPDQETMQEMIDDEVCKVCGRKAEKGSEPYLFMVHKLEEYRRHIEALHKAEEEKVEQKDLFVNNFIEEMHNLSISLGGSREAEVSELQSFIKDQIDLVERFKSNLSEAEEKVKETEDDKARLLIQADGLSESQMDLNFTNLKGYFENKGLSEKRLVQLSETQKEVQVELDEIEEEFEKLNPAGGLAKIYQKVHLVLSKISKAFVEARNVNLRNFLNELEKLANEYMDRLNANDFHGRIRLQRAIENNNTIKIKLMSDNEAEIKNPGGAQKTTMYMSVLFAISDLTGSRREETYPLIFDAPTSSFGSIKEDVFYNIIDKIDKQCIIVTKDLLVDGQLNSKKINELTCSVYRIMKKPGFDKNDLSTIQTSINKVK